MIPILALNELSAGSIPARSIVISTIEAEQPLLSVLSDEEMNFVKAMTDTASKIIWLTNADLLSCTRPDFAPVLGLSRSLMLEQPSLHFAVLDVDHASSAADTTALNVQNVLHQLIHEPNPDFEFAQKDDNLHVVRWEPEDALNKTFTVRQETETVSMAVQDAGRCQIDIRNAGQMDSIRFLQKEFASLTLGVEEVEIEVKSVGINAKVRSCFLCLFLYVVSCLSGSVTVVLVADQRSRTSTFSAPKSIIKTLPAQVNAPVWFEPLAQK
jgi:hypothetical protein